MEVVVQFALFYCNSGTVLEIGSNTKSCTYVLEVPIKFHLKAKMLMFKLEVIKIFAFINYNDQIIFFLVALMNGEG